jgi:hypothetical protein
MTMIKSPQDTVAILRELAAESLEFAAAARAKRDFTLCTLNLRGAFDSVLLDGLIQWRHGLASPVATLRELLTHVSEERSAASEVDWKDRTWWGISSAVVISYLLDSKFAIDFRAELPARSEWARLSIEGSGPVLDAGIIAAMAEEKIPPELDALLERMTKNKRVTLAYETYTNYLEIIRRCLANAPIEDLVRRAEQLFFKRKKNAYYYSAATEGGGLDNDYVVDYKLAAILKWCESRNPKSRVETIHAWRW